MRLLILFLTFCIVQACFSWGFYGHKKINEIAIFTLPKPLFAFYKTNSEYIISHSIDADKRRYAIPEEACRHFLDGDFYECCLPIDTIPKFYRDAIAKYSEDTVLAHGIVPWHISTMIYRLTEAFKNKDIAKILKYSADLGHYVGDCHVPLHASSNYNGQKTNQIGIHGLWESRLPELFNDGYDYFTGVAKYVKNPNIDIWEAYSRSFGLVDSVLKIELETSSMFDLDKKYALEQRGNQLVKVYSKEFCERYHKNLGNMVEMRLRASIIMLGNLWYSCWINAGQPNLEGMVAVPVPDEDDMIVPKEKMIGREEE